jgi:hypothetical protein
VSTLLRGIHAGEWWVELLRFYSSKELRLLAKAADARLHLPPDFQLSYELLRGMAHEHVRLRQVQGKFRVSALFLGCTFQVLSMLSDSVIGSLSSAG